MTNAIEVPKNGVTDTWLKRIRCTGKREEFSDPSTSGLRIRLAANETQITFIWRARRNDKFVTHTIGYYPVTTLAQARTKLFELKALHKSGQLKSAKEVAAETQKSHITLGQAMSDWYMTIVLRRKRPEKVLQVIDAEIFGKRRDFSGKPLAHLKLTDVKKSDVISLINQTISRGSPEHAMTILGTLKQFFKWAEDTMDIVDPIHRLQRNTFGISSARKTDEHILDIVNGEPTEGIPEIKRFVSVIDSAPRMSIEIKVALKILILTGVRVGELLIAKKSHVTDSGWFIPAENTKTQTEWLVPISVETKALFDQLPDSMFGIARHTTVNRAITRLREIHDLPKFTTHSLRKTFRSHIAGMTDYETAEKCLNHSLGGISSRYDKSNRLKERRAVLEAWADRVLS